MAVRIVDVTALALVLLCGICSALNSMDLAELLRGRQRLAEQKRTMDEMFSDNSAGARYLPVEIKRKDGGNPCNEPEKPFPCKTSSTCIPMSYVCDDNEDCEDGYDEDIALCTAAHRPPVEDITHFLENEKGWVIPNVFGGRPVGKIAHGLVVSETIDDFKRKVGLDKKELMNLRRVLKAVKEGDEKTLERMGMPPRAWDEVNFFMTKLIKSGFDS